jgi:Asp/Glu/hydantoin racemase
MLAKGALEALGRGDTATHDRLVVEAAQRVAATGCDVVTLAQFSLARSAPAVERTVAVPVLTTVTSAVRALRAAMV